MGQGTPPTLDPVPPSEEESWFTETQRVHRMASCFLKFRKAAVKATNKIKSTSYETVNTHDKLHLLHLLERIRRNNRKQNYHSASCQVDALRLTPGAILGGVCGLRGAHNPHKPGPLRAAPTCIAGSRTPRALRHVLPIHPRLPDATPEARGHHTECQRLQQMGQGSLGILLLLSKPK